MCWNSAVNNVKSLVEKEVGRRQTVDKVMYSALARARNAGKPGGWWGRREVIGRAGQERQVPGGRRVSNRVTHRFF